MTNDTTTAATVVANADADGDEVKCDYLVVGGGATGMAFCDTLLARSSESLRVIVVDEHDAPGGQWHDSYGFVRLHQPSSGYGVERRAFDGESTEGAHHRATRNEILEYYSAVLKRLEREHGLEFRGGTTLDLSQLTASDSDDDDAPRSYEIVGRGGVRTRVRVRRRVVDARNMEPDLPVSTPPRFRVDDAVDCVPVNRLADLVVSGEKKRFVVVGGGKTGMDAVVRLLTVDHVDPANLLWVVPNDAWITARENIGNCVDLLHTCAELFRKEHDDVDALSADELAAAASSPDFFHRGFLEWERRGKIYRIDESVVPTKFQDATLDREELAVLRRASSSGRVLGGSRVSEITANGDLVLADGAGVRRHEDLFPDADDVSGTLFLHCSASAFAFSKGIVEPRPVFDGPVLTARDVYGTPGFCFVGSLLGFLEVATDDWTDDDRNAACRAPSPLPPPPSSLGPSGGRVEGLTPDHGWALRTRNLKAWLKRPDLRAWAFSNRLFHWHGAADADAVEKKVDDVLALLDRLQETTTP